MDASYVALQDLRKSFGTTDVLHGIDLEIPQHSFVVLVGPSGCGKSTLLRMIAGLEKVKHERIVIDGQVVNRVHAKHRGIAMVFQSYALYPHMSVRENLAFSLEMFKTEESEIERRIKLAADILKLDQLLDRPPAQLSGGQRQSEAMGAPWCESPSFFSLTSHCPTSMRNCESRCGPRSVRFTNGCKAPRSMSHMIRSRP